MFRSTIRFAAALSLGACLLPVACHAALVSVAGTGTVTVSPLSDIVVGDQFQFAFTYDDSVTDVSAATTSGLFPNALTAYSLTALGGNTGIWTPGSGTAGSNQAMTVASVDLMNLQNFSTTGYNQANSLNLFQIIGPAMFLLNNDIVDTGSGQTLAAQLGGVPDFSALGATSNLQLHFGALGNASVVQLSLSNVAVVPEPASIVMLGTAGLLGVGLAIRRRRRTR